ncbi:MAG: restriction endonuclease [Candidatus Methylumidiphilus sp.]
MSKKKTEFVQWIPFVLDSLRTLGGSATPREVTESVALLAKVPETKRYEKNKGGALRFYNQVAWARQYLVWEGLVTSPKHGLWMLTGSGRDTHLTYETAYEIFHKWVKIHAARKAGKKSDDAEAMETLEEIEEHGEPEAVEDIINYREQVLSYLQSLKPSAFEQFCADLLKVLGFERVNVSGGVGDKGIDGEGYLPMGPLTTAKVAFQCKRYSGAVSNSDILAFIGAIRNRAEKGLFFTTGYFTASAKQAARDGNSSLVELIDGERLVDLLEQYSFGLREMKTFEMDYSFLQKYPLEGAQRNEK